MLARFRPDPSGAVRGCVVTLLTLLALPGLAQGFRSDSARFGNPKMHIVITETERRARTSVLDIEIKAVGSSVGSSFFIVCSLRDLARTRGNHRYIVKIEEQPRRGQMLVGFLKTADEAPERLDARFAGQKVIDVEYFAPICDQMN
jgi:hypothetical protein